MAAIFSALICGLVFGFGLLISGMTDPNKIFGFLDVLGRWDPSLGIVMAAALVFAAPGLLLARRIGRPIVGDQMRCPLEARGRLARRDGHGRHVALGDRAHGVEAQQRA